MWGSKTTKTSMGPNLDGFGVSHEGLDKPTCHPDMSELHADISSAAAEIFAASVALNELLHLGYVTSELGLSYPQPIQYCLRSIMLRPSCSRRIKSGALNFATSIVGKHGWRLYAMSTLSSCCQAD